MNFRDLLSLCAKNLMRRKTRTLLAVIGVMVGTCAVVVMLSIGFGMTKSYEEQIQNYGDLHMIELYNYGSGMSYGSPQEQQGVISDKTLASIEKMDGVTAVTPVVTAYMTIGIGKYVTTDEIVGIKPDVLEKFNYGLQEGRYLNNADKDALVFGSYIPQWFYNPQSKNYDSKEQDVITDKIILTADYEYGQKPQSGQTDDNKIEYKQYKMNQIGIEAIEWFRKPMRKALRNSRRFTEPGHIEKTAEEASAIASTGNQCGEGWLLTGEMIELIKDGVPNIACLQPFACLPNHVTGKGMMKAIRERFPKANIVAIDYDPGASNVNQLNRIKLMMATAHKNLRV